MSRPEDDGASYAARCSVCGVTQYRFGRPIEDGEHIEHSSVTSQGLDVDGDVAWERWAACPGRSVSLMGRTNEEWYAARDALRLGVTK